MLHASPRPGLRRRILPVLLLSAGGTAFAGLVALGPATPTPTVLTAVDVSALPMAEVPVEREVARASRSRRLAERQAAEERARAAAAAKVKAEAEAKAKAEAEAAARAKAEAEAKAKADAAAKATARSGGALASRTAVRGSTACPVPNASFTDTWGAPRSGGRSHRGTDLMAPYGSPVYAVASGTVRTASSSAGGISLYLHADNGETYFYAHNAENLVGSGQRVQVGQLVARVGTSGNAPSSAPHVHFERQVGGRAVNPYAFLRAICG